MRVSRIMVNGLFGRFNHAIDFKRERIAIVIGPNGIGKTWILRILSAVFTRPLESLLSMPFRELLLEFDDSSQLEVKRDAHGSETAARPELTLTLSGRTKGPLTFKVPSSADPRFSFPAELIEDALPELAQAGPGHFKNLATGEILDSNDVTDQYGEVLTRFYNVARGGAKPETPDWLTTIRKSIPVRLIDTERLTQTGQRNPRTRRPASVRTVSRYSEELGELVQRTLAEYATLSQSLDRTFPARLVANPAPWTARSPVEIQRVLEAIEQKRAQLVDAGLLVQEHEVLSMPLVATVEADKAAVLGVYATDADKKLAVFDDLFARVQTFRRIANSRLLYKRLNVGRDGFSVVTVPDNEQLSLEMLSSGEQHELVFLYHFLFRVPDDSLILFDEPELSLHVAWQEQFLTDLEEMAKLSKFNVLMATHSPQVIGDRWDLTIELKGPNGAG